jgi:hypothetical protein
MKFCSVWRVHFKRKEQSIKWYKKEVIRKLEMENLFVKDNYFIFDKASWNSILTRGIILKSNNQVINMKKSTRKRILDGKDNKRANNKYIELLEEFKMNQRINYLKK